MKNNRIQREFMPYNDVIKSINFYLSKQKEHDHQEQNVEDGFIDVTEENEEI